MPLATARHFRPRRAVPRSLSKESRTDVTWIESLLSESAKLNLMGRTFTRATSAWDPKYNCICPPGVARQRPIRYLDRFTIMADLIEGPATNLLAAGSSDRFDLWSAITAQLVGGQVAPDGSLTAWTVTDSSAAAFQSLQQTITVANDASVYCISMYILKTSGGTSATFGINATLTGGTSVSANPRVNLDTGGILGATGSPVMTSVGAYWRLSMTITNNTSGNTSLNISIFPATAANGQSVDAATAIGSATLAWAQVEKAAFPSSYISNRNLQTQTQRYDNATWTKTDTAITTGATTGPLSGLVDGQLATEGVAGTASVLNVGVLVTASATCSTSGYFKRGNHDFILLQASNGAITSGFRQWFNLNLGTAGTSQAFGTGTFAGSSITSVGGGWFRISITGTIGAFTVFVQSTFSAVSDASTTRVNNAQRYMYGTQLEYGTTATAYWGVNATVGGRDADNLTVNLSGLSGGGLSTTAGTLVGYITPYGWTGNAGGVSAFLADDATTSGNVTLSIGSGGLVTGARKDSVGVKVGGAPAGTPSNGVLEMTAMTWDGTQIISYRNGVAGTPTATVPPYVASTSIKLGAAQGANFQSYGYVALLYEPRAWTALELSLVGTAQLAAP